MVPDDADRRRLVVNLIYAVAWFMGGVVLLAMREGKVARSSRAVGLTFIIGSAVIGLVFVVGITGSGVEPGFADLLFLLPLITLIRGFRSEIRHHVPPGDRRELVTDAALIVCALMTAGYVVIRPTVRDTGRLGLGRDLRAGRRVPRRDVSRPGDLDPDPGPCRARGGVRGARRRRLGVRVAVDPHDR